ncbi:PBECR4 domain-containing protein [Companilactobacillus nantensis]|uniref:Phage-Barnase-EndoU-ColicinE5/D-RelE like nuclease 4 domain-containing protein n=2 Tax=Companilactobacillus nantensis TaxID=305793 RepID=A0A0R1WFA6_9LACO|nr:PBECR4 domain-containing protein [Companilactobacillus nantensis]KRM14315.1 hypothetical protein FD31_GL002007 [Companilactobacillus nantensis DSM 16982]
MKGLFMRTNKDEAMHYATASEIEILNRFKGNIIKAYAVYDKKFLNKKVIYKTQKRTVVLVCRKSNFMHLCGIDYYNNNNGRFFSDCKRGTLNFKRNCVKIKNDGNTYRKLQVIGCLGDLLIQDKARLVGNTIKIFSSYDYILRSSAAVIGLGCSWDGKRYFPKSILNLKYEHLVAGEKIEKILIENLI